MTFDFTSYGTNVAGTITAAIIFGAAWICKNKCKHSKCAIDSGCFKFSADDADTIRGIDLKTRPNTSEV